ncbi:hypothetical protein QQ045_010100 [Rhodiola kirilowii]
MVSSKVYQWNGTIRVLVGDRDRLLVDSNSKVWIQFRAGGATQVGRPRQQPGIQNCGRGPGLERMQRAADQCFPGSTGTGFTTHRLFVELGQDITAKITSASPEGPKFIFILKASGTIATAVLAQPKFLTIMDRREEIEQSGSRRKVEGS